VPDTAPTTIEAAGDGQERDLESLHVALEQGKPRLVNRRREQARGDAERARLGSVVLDAGRRASRVCEKSAIEGDGMRRRGGSQLVG
jgi:hypothetical protein